MSVAWLGSSSAAPGSCACLAGPGLGSRGSSLPPEGSDEEEPARELTELRAFLLKWPSLRALAARDRKCLAQGGTCTAHRGRRIPHQSDRAIAVSLLGLHAGSYRTRDVPLIDLWMLLIVASLGMWPRGLQHRGRVREGCQRTPTNDHLLPVKTRLCLTCSETAFYKNSQTIYVL